MSEEQGLDGAKALDPSLVASRRLVNLDGTSDDAITVGCAGSDHTFLRLALAPEPVSADKAVLRVELSGVQGGHSGADIDKGRANAIKALGSALGAAFERAPFRIAGFSGGVSRNAIPRAAKATVALPADDVESFRAAVAEAQSAFRRRFAETDGGVALTVAEGEAAGAADSCDDATRARSHRGGPDGRPLARARSARCGRDQHQPHGGDHRGGDAHASPPWRAARAQRRSTSSSRRCAPSRGSAERRSRCGAPIRPGSRVLESELLGAAKTTYTRLFAAEPALDVVHGGLECAVLGQRLPGVEMIAIGPEIVGPHAPGEKVRISSVQRFYRLLGELLDELSRGSDTR